MTARPEDIETLKMILEVLGDEYIITNKQANDYLVKNRHDVLAAYDDIILQHELQRLEKQKPPSKKKKLPSPSYVIEGLDELENAILRSLEDEPSEGREADQKPFEVWINEFSEENPVRAKLLNLFNGGGWTVVNPRGDGFCGLYIAAIDFQNNHARNTDPLLLDRVLQVERDGLIELIIDGMKKYYEARDRHNELGIRIPDELGDNMYINIDDNDPTSYFLLTQELLLTNEEFIRTKLRILERLANTPESVFRYLPYIYKRSYLILTYDSFRNASPFLTTFMPCYADVVIDALGNAFYPYNDFTNSAVMFNNGHYFLLNNPNSAIKAQFVNEIIANKLSDVPIRLWQVRYAMGKRIRKRKVTTKKVGTKKVGTKKVGTHKPRTHKPRTHKPRTHKPRTHKVKKQ